MDLNITDIFKSSIITILKDYWYILLLIILFFILLYLFKTFLSRLGKKADKKISGFMGEKKVSSILAQLNPEEYKVINNKTLFIDRQKAQIDHLIISVYGIFVIETKNYEGIIYGEEDSNYWTQVLYKSRQNFYNPIRQNRWHIQALKNALTDYPNPLYIPIVVFTNQSDLRVKTSADVVKTDDLIKTIMYYKKETISDAEVERIYNYLRKEY